MRMLFSCELITFSPDAHEAGEDPVYIRRTVKCTELGVSMTEAYQAMGLGLSPEMKIVLAHDFEYGGEPLCEVHGVRFRIIRTYITEDDGIELTVQREAGNARGTGVANNAQSV